MSPQRALKSFTAQAQQAHRSEDRPLMTVEQLRVHLGLPSHKAVYRLIEQQGLPFRRVGARYRFAWAEVEQWTLGARSTAQAR